MAHRSHYPILKLQDFEGFDGMLLIDISKELKRSYEAVRSAVKRLGIRDRFPRHGGEAVKVARNGYI